MPKKFVPDEELLNRILKLYEECHNYSAVSREVKLTPAMVKRIIVENTTDNKNFLPQSQELPVEPSEPCSKIQFYYQLQLLAYGENKDV